jgi:glycine cleavage system aminomethyltransferase T
MLEKRGHVAKRLVQLRCEALVERGAPIADPEGKTIGEVTSALAGQNGSLALGYVKYKYARSGRELVVEGAPARVTERLAIDGD